VTGPLADRLAAFDGKHVEPLERLADELPRTNATARRLLASAEREEPRLQVASTWLLKRWNELGFAFTPAQSRRIVKLLGAVTAWEAKLHLLQTLPGLVIPGPHAEALHTVLRQLLTEENKLVRAWTYHGLFVLGEQHYTYREDMSQLLANGQSDSAASVRARIRNILAASNWA